MLQVARFLIKSLNQLQKGKKLPESVSYLAKLIHIEEHPEVEISKNNIRAPSTIQSIMINHSCLKAKGAAEKMMLGVS
jgi:hypothetical protein